jgi:hypothetical protein
MKFPLYFVLYVPCEELSQIKFLEFNDKCNILDIIVLSNKLFLRSAVKCGWSFM